MKGETMIDAALHDLNSSYMNGNGYENDFPTWNNHVFKHFADETIKEDPDVGPEFLRGILKWVKHTRSQPPKDQLHFETFHQYVEYRIGDFAAE